MGRAPVADADAGNTSRLVGGAFDYALEGTFDQKYTLHVIYANGTTADVTIPMFRVTVTNPTSGAVVRTITAPVPPRAEPLLLDLSPPTGPTEVISPPQSLVDVDPRSPISIVFSRALDQVRQLRERLHSSRHFSRRERLFFSRQEKRQHVERGQLRGEAFGSRNRDLFAGARKEVGVGFSRNSRVHDV
jgi:hypothetical protein